MKFSKQATPISSRDSISINMESAYVTSASRFQNSHFDKSQLQ